MEFLQDATDSYSVKRLVLLIMVVVFVVLCIGPLIHTFDKVTLGQIDSFADKAKELIKWMGGFVLAEKIPDVAAATSGKATTASVKPADGH